MQRFSTAVFKQMQEVNSLLEPINEVGSNRNDEDLTSPALSAFKAKLVSKNTSRGSSIGAHKLIMK